MKRLFILAIMCACSLGLRAQVVDTTICDVLKDPVAFNGKIVRLKGTVAAGFDSFVVMDQSCQSRLNSIWLTYPEGTKGKAGPMALLELQPAKNFEGPVQPAARTSVRLEKNKDFKEFDTLLSTPHKLARTCMGCVKYRVSATLVGRLDGVGNAKIWRNASGKIVRMDGFGNMNSYPARLVLQSVSDVEPKEVDFTKAEEVVKSQPPDSPDTFSNQVMNSISNTAMSNFHGSADSAPNQSINPLQAIDNIQTAIIGYGGGSPLADALGRAEGVYGKHGEHSSVVLNYGNPNEVEPKIEAQSSRESPDGVIYNCSLNAARLQGPALAAATVHMGEHVADLRSPQPDVKLNTLFDLEYQGWATTVLEIVFSKQRTLTASGGFTLWNEFWSQSERNQLLDRAISDYLRKEEMITR